MWAGGRIQTRGPLLVGHGLTRRTRIVRTEERQGRSGLLRFVTVAHEVEQRGQIVVEEWQDVVYRSPNTGSAATRDLVTGCLPLTAGERRFPVDPTMLFRFSALTYNAHRIHYDREFAGEVEGYPGLVTHGPLQALAMTETARAAGLMPTGQAVLEYRLRAPLFEHQGLVARARAIGDGSVDVGVRDLSGRQTATGTLTTEDGRTSWP
ncbi:FAS1-like dehydratase domain-containing protein [Nocardioides sp.]|uniref:FAS1-like dehydratase domain-containing protein n=1 Tax=Nocardioides sp. TaxID=35761 RepID=UPI003D106705